MGLRHPDVTKRARDGCSAVQAVVSHSTVMWHQNYGLRDFAYITLVGTQHILAYLEPSLSYKHQLAGLEHWVCNKSCICGSLRRKYQMHVLQDAIRVLRVAKE
jgi:hypothetical protein